MFLLQSRPFGCFSRRFWRADGSRRCWSCGRRSRHGLYFSSETDAYCTSLECRHRPVAWCGEDGSFAGPGPLFTKATLTSALVGPRSGETWARITWNHGPWPSRRSAQAVCHALACPALPTEGCRSNPSAVDGLDGNGPLSQSATAARVALGRLTNAVFMVQGYVSLSPGTLVRLACPFLLPRQQPHTSPSPPVPALFTSHTPQKKDIRRRIACVCFLLSCLSTAAVPTRAEGHQLLPTAEGAACGARKPVPFSRRL